MRLEPITFSRRHSICSLVALSATLEDVLVESTEDVSEMRMLLQAARLLRTLMNKRLSIDCRIRSILCFFEGLVLLDECSIAGSDAVLSVLCALRKKSTNKRGAPIRVTGNPMVDYVVYPNLLRRKRLHDGLLKKSLPPSR